MAKTKIKKEFLWIGGAFLLALLLVISYNIRQSNEYPIKICTVGGRYSYCVRAKQAQLLKDNIDCIATDSGSIICGDFILKIKKGVEVKNEK